MRILELRNVQIWPILIRGLGFIYNNQSLIFDAPHDAKPEPKSFYLSSSPTGNIARRVGGIWMRLAIQVVALPAARWLIPFHTPRKAAVAKGAAGNQQRR